MVFGGFGSVNLRRHISFSRGRVRMQRSWISVSDWESQAGCEPPEVNSPRPAPWLSPSIFQGALEGDNKWKFKKFPTECFWSVHQGNRKLCTSQVCVSSLWMCSLRLARRNLLTALLRLKEKKKKPETGFPEIQWPLFSLPQWQRCSWFPPASASHSRKWRRRGCVWNVSEPTQGLWLWPRTKIPSGNLLHVTQVWSS